MNTAKKRTSITAALATAAGKPQPEATATVDEPKQIGKKDTGLVPVAAHYPPEVRKILKMIAAETGRNLRQVLGEAINDLCHKYNKPQPYRDEI